MPIKRKYKRKRYRRKRRYKRRKLVSNSVPSGMPTIRRGNLRYSTGLSIASTAGVLTTHTFRANSPYDPDFTGTGHQPMGYDQWSALFNHYVVLGSRITIQCTQQANSLALTEPMAVGIYLSDGSTPPYTDWTFFKEARKGVIRFSPAQPGKSLYLKHNYSAKRFFNISDVKDNVTRIGAPVTANPTDDAYFMVWAQGQGSGSTAQFLRVLVTIDYIVEFSEPKDLTSS